MMLSRRSCQSAAAAAAPAAALCKTHVSLGFRQADPDQGPPQSFLLRSPTRTHRHIVVGGLDTSRIRVRHQWSQSFQKLMSGGKAPKEGIQ